MTQSGPTLASVLLVVCVNCSDRRDVIEDPGPVLAGDVAAFSAADIAWLPGGDEIAYVSMASELVAVRVADRGRRQLDPARPYFVSGLARSRDGSALYFSALDESAGIARFTLREAFTHTEVPVGEVMQGSPAVSPNARRVLYWTSNGASVLDASGAIFGIAGCVGWPVSPIFSPTGDQVLCAGEHPAMITLADGSAQPLPDTSSSSWRAVRWSGAAPQAVALAAEDRRQRVYLIDVLGGTKRLIYESAVGLLYLAAISDDGRFVAFWETECLRAESILTCEAHETEARLKVVEVSARHSATIASGADNPGPLAFSDDGTQIAYVFRDGSLHVRPVP